MRNHGRTIEAQWRAQKHTALRPIAPTRTSRTFGDVLNYLWSFVWMR